MKEHEFIAVAIEEELSDQLTGVICRENYEGKSYPDGYRRIFDEYGKLHNLYLENKDTLLKDDGSLDTYRKKWEKNCSDRVDDFIKDLKMEHNGLDIDKCKDEYYKKLENEDLVTPEKRVFIYPYLISKMRTHNSERRVEGIDSRI